MVTGRRMTMVVLVSINEGMSLKERVSEYVGWCDAVSRAMAVGEWIAY